MVSVGAFAYSGFPGIKLSDKHLTAYFNCALIGVYS